MENGGQECLEDLELLRISRIKTAFIFMTNMSPQVPSFNRGIWAGIEKVVRRKVREWGTGHVITAPVLTSSLDQIFSGVSVPDQYYKMVYFPQEERILTFLIENRRYPRTDLNKFLVPVDQVEALTGFDFFSDLPDVLEESLESQTFSL